MDEKHPNRKKDKVLYELFNRFELEDISYLNRVSRHIENSELTLELIRTIDKQRLKQYMGMMPHNIMARVDKALAISISLNNRPDRKCAN